MLFFLLLNFVNLMQRKCQLKLLCHSTEDFHMNNLYHFQRKKCQNDYQKYPKYQNP